jgi:hypothetical protein
VPIDVAVNVHVADVIDDAAKREKGIQQESS